MTSNDITGEQELSSCLLSAAALSIFSTSNHISMIVHLTLMKGTDGETTPRLSVDSSSDMQVETFEMGQGMY
jgi:hypothetical protein